MTSTARHERSRQPATHTPCGVTLLEVVMVVSVISVGAVIGVFFMDNQWNAERQLEGDTQNLRQALKVIRDTAITQRAGIRVTFDTRQTQLIVDQAAGPLSPAKRWLIPLATDSDIRPSARNITFNPTGSADRNLDVTLSKDRTKSEVLVTAVNGVIQ